ncbi:MAG: tRNA (adenosine(37)-N6)-dimethylallyltransferase MiaA [Pirellulaceae bacterium]|nr:tRNA (adenosine(37)-N6)-dimethylallyltransferase MiaA [Pirellulaceae bacterium]
MKTPSSDSSTTAASAAQEFRHWVLPRLANCWYLTGPTSSGKSSLAVAIAQRLNAEIISMDSMAIYCGMDIGTAKPSPEQRRAVPHHQLDIVAPTEMFSVSSYVSSTHQVASQIHARGRNVLICGGTPLYLKSLLRGLFLGPAADWQFRQAIEDDLAIHGMEALRDRLKQVDPLMVYKLHPNDKRRMIRALEVARTTGQPLSHWQQQFDIPAPVQQCPTLVLRLERSWLHELINQRVQRMIDGGLQAEVDGLLDRYGQLSRTAAQAVGYREMLDRREVPVPIDETIQQIRAHTRQFARRQEIWFRGLSELQSLPVTPESQLEELVQQAVQFYTSFPQQPT